jgi:hypothetical protein
METASEELRELLLADFTMSSLLVSRTDAEERWDEGRAGEGEEEEEEEGDDEEESYRRVVVAVPYV